MGTTCHIDCLFGHLGNFGLKCPHSKTKQIICGIHRGHHSDHPSIHLSICLPVCLFAYLKIRAYTLVFWESSRQLMPGNGIAQLQQVLLTLCHALGSQRSQKFHHRRLGQEVCQGFHLLHCFGFSNVCHSFPSIFELP